MAVLFIVFLGVGSRLLPVKAEQFDPQLASYRFHLFYDNGRLSPDKDFEFSYDIVSQEFQQPNITGLTYRGIIVNFAKNTEGSFRFSPNKGDSNFKKGKIQVDAPYFADASNVKFYNDKDELILTLNLSGSSSCDDNNICDSDAGENHDNCPNDCKSTTATGLPSESPFPVVSGGISPIIKVVIAVVALLLIIMLIWFIIKKRKSNEKNI